MVNCSICYNEDNLIVVGMPVLKRNHIDDKWFEETRDMAFCNKCYKKCFG